MGVPHLQNPIYRESAFSNEPKRQLNSWKKDPGLEIVGDCFFCVNSTLVFSINTFCRGPSFLKQNLWALSLDPIKYPAFNEVGPLFEVGLKIVTPTWNIKLILDVVENHFSN